MTPEEWVFACAPSLLACSVACQPATARTPAGKAASGESSVVGVSRMLKPQSVHSLGQPPWHVELNFDECIAGPQGRWSVKPDRSDHSGRRHVLSYTGADATSWTLEVSSPGAIARRLDDHVVLLDWEQGASLVSPAGERLWRRTFPRCGAVAQLAIGWDDSIIFACGYSLLKLRPDGELWWQKWPAGNHFIVGPWVDRNGIIYVAGGDRVLALRPDGTQRWSVRVGFDRGFSQLAWTSAGNLVFDTSMAGLHSEPVLVDGRSYRFYYEYEPNELFEVSRDGNILRRTKHPSPANGRMRWPTVLPRPSDGSHRIVCSR